MIAAHLFVSEVDGALYDTRAPDWNKGAPVRARYRLEGAAPFDLQSIKAAIRNGATTDLGGYPRFFLLSDGGALSFAGARQAWREIVAEYLTDSRTGWRIECVDINYEDSDLICDHTGERIPSAYAED